MSEIFDFSNPGHWFAAWIVLMFVVSISVLMVRVCVLFWRDE